MKGFNISEFNSNALQCGIMRASNFIVTIATPPCAQKIGTRWMTYLCSSVSLPGTTLGTADEMISGYGKPTKVPFSSNHSDQLAATFISDGNGNVDMFFEEWLRNIVSYGDPSKSRNNSVHGEVQYPAFYTSPKIEIFQFNDKTDREVIKYTILDAFPVMKTEQALDWSNNESMLFLPVSFAYLDYVVETFPTTAGGSLSSVLGAAYGSMFSLLSNSESITSGSLSSTISGALTSMLSSALNNALSSVVSQIQLPTIPSISLPTSFS